MATPTYVSLGTITLSSTDSEIVFSSIPATYRDLVLVANIFITADMQTRLRLNSDSGSNYSFVYMYGGSSGVLSGSAGSITDAFAEWTLNNGNVPNTPKPLLINIMDYSATDKHKTILTRLNDMSQTNATAIASRWANTAAVTSISFGKNLGGNFNAGTTISLYGIH